MAIKEVLNSYHLSKFLRNYHEESKTLLKRRGYQIVEKKSSFNGECPVS